MADGYWVGVDPDYVKDPVPLTAYCLYVLAYAQSLGFTPTNYESAITNAVAWLKTAQNSDGGWGTEHSDGASNAFSTPLAIISLMEAGESPTEHYIQNGTEWLLSHRVDSYWSSSVYYPWMAHDPEVTSFAIIALLHTNHPNDDPNVTAALDWLVENAHVWLHGSTKDGATTVWMFNELGLIPGGISMTVNISINDHYKPEVTFVSTDLDPVTVEISNELNLTGWNIFSLNSTGTGDVTFLIQIDYWVPHHPENMSSKSSDNQVTLALTKEIERVVTSSIEGLFRITLLLTIWQSSAGENGDDTAQYVVINDYLPSGFSLHEPSVPQHVVVERFGDYMISFIPESVPVGKAFVLGYNVIALNATVADGMVLRAAEAFLMYQPHVMTVSTRPVVQSAFRVIEHSPEGTDVPITTSINVTFNHIADKISCENAFSLIPEVDGAFEWSTDGKTMIFTPSENLAYGTEYTVTIGMGAANLIGIPMESEYTWAFVTEPMPTIWVVDYNPKGEGVPITTQINITFSSPMNITAAETAFSISPQVDGQFLWSDTNTTLTFIPVSSLAYSTTYNVTINFSASDVHGFPLAHDFSWEFTTEPDTIPPEIVEFGPQADADDVNISTEIWIRFSEPMNTISVQEAFSINPDVEGSYQWDASKTEMRFVPHPALAYDTSYTITVGCSATDLAGNSLVSEVTWSFHTEHPPDIVPPTIISAQPTGDKVPVTVNIEIVFNEPMDVVSIEAAFLISPTLNGTTYWPDQMHMVFDPEVNLTYSTKYTVSVTTEAMDLSGNRLVEPYVWSFTTTFQDLDNDTLPDTWEEDYGLNPGDPTDAYADLDGDELSNLEEYALGTDPTSKDTDEDGMDDRWEVKYGLDPLRDDAGEDKDDDGYSNIEEYHAGTDPTDAASKPSEEEPRVIFPTALVIGIIAIIITVAVILFVLRYKKKRKEGIPRPTPPSAPTPEPPREEPKRDEVEKRVPAPPIRKVPTEPDVKKAPTKPPDEGPEDWDELLDEVELPGEKQSSNSDELTETVKAEARERSE
jgi:hypothetical protein